VRSGRLAPPGAFRAVRLLLEPNRRAAHL